MICSCTVRHVLFDAAVEQRTQFLFCCPAMCAQTRRLVLRNGESTDPATILLAVNGMPDVAWTLRPGLLLTQVGNISRIRTRAFMQVFK